MSPNTRLRRLLSQAFIQKNLLVDDQEDKTQVDRALAARALRPRQSKLTSSDRKKLVDENDFIPLTDEEQIEVYAKAHVEQKKDRGMKVGSHRFKTKKTPEFLFMDATAGIFEGQRVRFTRKATDGKSTRDIAAMAVQRLKEKAGIAPQRSTKALKRESRKALI